MSVKHVKHGHALRTSTERLRAIRVLPQHGSPVSISMHYMVRNKLAKAWGSSSCVRHVVTAIETSIARNRRSVGQRDLLPSVDSAGAGGRASARTAPAVDGDARAASQHRRRRPVSQPRRSAMAGHDWDSEALRLARFQTSMALSCQWGPLPGLGQRPLELAHTGGVHVSSQLGVFPFIGGQFGGMQFGATAVDQLRLLASIDPTAQRDNVLPNRSETVARDLSSKGGKAEESSDESTGSQIDVDHRDVDSGTEMKHAEAGRGSEEMSQLEKQPRDRSAHVSGSDATDAEKGEEQGSPSRDYCSEETAELKIANDRLEKDGQELQPMKIETSQLGPSEDDSDVGSHLAMDAEMDSHFTTAAAVARGMEALKVNTFHLHE